MTTIAVLGLGQMGRRMAARLVDAGHDTRVWTRSGAGDVPGLDGASKARSPAEAAEGADAVIAMVRDDLASEAVWEGGHGALAAMSDGALAIEMSTVSTNRAHAFATTARAAGARAVLAPVAGSLPQAEAGALIVLAGGDAKAVAAAEPVLAPLAGRTIHLGEPAEAAAFKLMVNALFAGQVALMAEIAALGARAGIAPDRSAALLEGLPVTSPAAAAAMGAIAAGRFEPMFPIELVAKDMALAARATPGAPLLDALQIRYAAAKAAGHGGLNITGVAKLLDA